MSLKYDEGQFGVVERFYFRLYQDANDMSADTAQMSTRFYPKGPIEILRFGIQHIVAQGGTEVTIALNKNGTAVGTVVASTDTTQWTITSKSLVSEGVGATFPAGDYLTITSAGTVATGSIECFMDFRRSFDASWEADPPG